MTNPTSHSIAPLRVVAVSVVTTCSQPEASKLTNANGCEILSDKDEIALITLTACWDIPHIDISAIPINIILTNQSLLPSRLVSEAVGTARVVMASDGEFGTEWEVKELGSEVLMLRAFRDVIKSLDPDVIAVRLCQLISPIY